MDQRLFFSFDLLQAEEMIHTNNRVFITIRALKDQHDV